MQEYSKQRRRHSAPFKAEVLQACEQPGASIAAVALAFGLNANLVRQWRRGRGVQRLGLVGAVHAGDAPRFIPVKLEEATTRAGDSGGVELQAQRGGLSVSVRWPAEQAGECARLLRELLR